MTTEFIVWDKDAQLFIAKIYFDGEIERTEDEEKAQTFKGDAWHQLWTNQGYEARPVIFCFPDVPIGTRFTFADDQITGKVYRKVSEEWAEACPYMRIKMHSHWMVRVVKSVTPTEAERVRLTARSVWPPYGERSEVQGSPGEGR